jgi:hypothetical protein
MNNHYVKYEDFVTNNFQDNRRRPFWLFMPMWPWCLNLWPPDQKGSSNSYDQSICDIWRLCNKYCNIPYYNLRPYNLDLWPCDKKFNWDHLLVMNNHYVKYKDCVIKSFQDNEQKPFWHLRPLWHWPLTKWPQK